MRKRVVIALASASAAASLAFGAASASATTTFHCTRTVDHNRTVHVTVKGDKAEDALEAHGFSCTR
ncbi:MAG TPA: hypothetical protein VGL78_16670 [Solirubrobacteraceae bacterium]|jgi:ABC-type sugar transport system substrate-binding protein